MMQNKLTSVTFQKLLVSKKEKKKIICTTKVDLCDSGKDEKLAKLHFQSTRAPQMDGEN